MYIVVAVLSKQHPLPVGILAETGGVSTVHQEQ